MSSKEIEKISAEQNRIMLEEDIKSLKNVWGHSDVGIQGKKAAMTMLSTKTGLYAKVPIVCKRESCPYVDSCVLVDYDLAPLGEFCPVETAQIELRYVEYDKDFSLQKGSFTDQCLVSEIIYCDIMMERCKALMSKESDPVIDVVAAVGEDGNAFTRPEISKYWEIYERVQKKRNEAYQLMLATRKDKKDDGTAQDWEEYISEGLAVVEET